MLILRAIMFAMLLATQGLHAQSPEFHEQLQPPTSLPAESRVWKDSTGKYEIAARINALKDNVALLEKADGDKLQIPLSRLSEVDAIFARQATSLRGDPGSKVILGKVVKILGGDTLRVANALESVQTVRLASAEDFTKSNGLQIWSDKEQIAPWDFRNRVRTKSAKPVNVPSIRSTDTTVYITKTGTHYHSEGCRHLAKSKIPIPLSWAVSAYTACQHCSPPGK
jgi:hypothetical protein